jgi:ferredoxin
MRLSKIRKADVKELLHSAAGQWQTYVPLKNAYGDTLFTILPKDGGEFKQALDRLYVGGEWVVISPKDIFFPQAESMFTFGERGFREEVEVSKKLIFGIAACDTKAVLFSDAFFKRNFQDKYYLSRAENRLIVTVGCLRPPRPKACFCTSVKTGPFLETGYDLQLVDIGEEYLVEIGSVQGEDFLNSYSSLFKNPTDNEVEQAKAVKSRAAQAVELKVDFEKALEVMQTNRVFKENYRSISERCIYCAGCIYTCPSCTCFNVFDEKRENHGVRKRNWDACVFEGYTREASGHNPRKEKWLRTARRYEHKLKYDYSVTGSSGCVGCGRCFASCPVNIGMSGFIAEITQSEK